MIVTCVLWCLFAAGSTSMRASRGTRTPSVLTTWPFALTQPFSIHSSASRREHRPRSPISFDRRGSSGVSVGSRRGVAGLGGGSGLIWLGGGIGLDCLGGGAGLDRLGGGTGLNFFGGGADLECFGGGVG